MRVTFTKLQRDFFTKVLVDAQTYVNSGEFYAYGFGYLEGVLERISLNEECYFNNKEKENV